MKTEENLPVISIITPVYNTLEYLPACVDSILAQTFPDFELILVDDGSTDGSETLCDDYAARDPRVVVLHQANQRQAAARNHGLDAARGQYIAFVDSDDAVMPEYLEKLYSAITSTNTDIVMCNAESFSTTGNCTKPFRWGHDDYDSKITGIQAAQLLAPDHEHQPAYGVLWNKLYKRSVIHGIRFDVKRKYEDGIYLHQVYLNTDIIVRIPSCLYKYRINPDGVMHEVSLTAYYEGIAGYSDMLQLFQEIHYMPGLIATHKSICDYILAIPPDSLTQGPDYTYFLSVLKESLSELAHLSGSIFADIPAQFFFQLNSKTSFKGLIYRLGFHAHNALQRIMFWHLKMR